MKLFIDRAAMEISCRFGREVHSAGSYLTALLSFSCLEEITYREAVILAQVCGYASSDPRWTNTSASKIVEMYDQTPNMPLNESVQIPSGDGRCIFLSPREVISTSHMRDGGVFILADLPADLLPSFKGLCSSIKYAINVTVQIPGEANKTVSFPFTVNGCGSSYTPYHLRFSSLSTFSEASIPMENFFLPRGIQETEDDSDNTMQSAATAAQGPNSLLGVVYNISAPEFICSALIICSHGNEVYPGDDICISLCFEGGIQLCKSVKATLLQREKRPDGSRVQERVVSECVRSAVGAVNLSLQYNLQDNLSSSFKTPLFEISYEISMEFLLDRVVGDIDPNSRISGATTDGAEAEEEPSTWSLPLVISPILSSKCMNTEITCCYDPFIEIIQKVK